jgi:hypothetical protein
MPTSIFSVASACRSPRSGQLVTRVPRSFFMLSSFRGSSKGRWSASVTAPWSWSNSPPFLARSWTRGARDQPSRFFGFCTEVHLFRMLGWSTGGDRHRRRNMHSMLNPVWTTSQAVLAMTEFSPRGWSWSELISRRLCASIKAHGPTSSWGESSTTVDNPDWT